MRGAARPGCSWARPRRRAGRLPGDARVPHGGGPLDAVGGADPHRPRHKGPDVSAANLAAWSALTTGGHTTAALAAGHNLLRDCPEELAATLRQALP
ncbi:hypothetical protein [Streptomyces sp. NPDC059080]|uniref:hypothetical protein n=1 Tax=Streptomyces sp. NPDC059080 TaxID=3346718 RepID=UPI0036BB756B